MKKKFAFYSILLMNYFLCGVNNSFSYRKSVDNILTKAKSLFPVNEQKKRIGTAFLLAAGAGLGGYYLYNKYQKLNNAIEEKFNNIEAYVDKVIDSYIEKTTKIENFLISFQNKNHRYDNNFSANFKAITTSATKTLNDKYFFIIRFLDECKNFLDLINFLTSQQQYSNKKNIDENIVLKKKKILENIVQRIKGLIYEILYIGDSIRGQEFVLPEF